MYVALIIPTEITRRVMFVGVGGFLGGVRTLSSFTAHSTELFSVLTVVSFSCVDVLDAGMARERKILTDPPPSFLSDL